jgi:RNA polymerase sigma-70 factor, ECF subfamily
LRDSPPDDCKTLSHDPAAAALIRQIVDGDESAMTSLYDATRRLLFGLVVRIVSDRSAAEEVLLDVYSHIWRRAEDYEPASGDPISWLMGVARTRAIDCFRAMNQSAAEAEAEKPVSAEETGDGGASEFPITTARRKLVGSALDSLPQEQRQIIELAYYYGLSHSEIANRLELPLATVKMRARLGMIKLSDLLRPLFDGRA